MSVNISELGERMPAKKRKQPKHKVVYKRLKKKAPRVPDITCPAIDDVINRLELLANTDKQMTTRTFKTLSAKLEKLRTANEQLRESGMYWNQATKDLIEEYIQKKTKTRGFDKDLQI